MTAPTIFDEIFTRLTPDRLLGDPRATGEGVAVAVIDSGVERAVLEDRFRLRGVELHPIEGAIFRPGSSEPRPYTGHQSSPHGTTVAEGSVMLLLNGSANRDERHWNEPDRFDVCRDDGPHLSFGYGLHFCLGAALARLEGRVALEEVLRRWPDWEVDVDAGKMAHTASVRGWGYLPMRPERQRV